MVDLHHGHTRKTERLSTLRFSQAMVQLQVQTITPVALVQVLFVKA